MINDKWTSGCNTYTTNSIYSRDNIYPPPIVVYCVGIYGVPAGIIWLTLYSHFLTDVQPVVVLWISALCLAGVWGHYIFPALALLSHLSIYCHLITLTGVSLAAALLGWRGYISVIVGIMFSLNALFASLPEYQFWSIIQC